jgi:hypothetical protein
MTQPKLALATALALSLGLMNSSLTPTVREIPLSKSDIVIAAGETGTTSGKDSAKTGAGAGSNTAGGQESGDKITSEKTPPPSSTSK